MSTMIKIRWYSINKNNGYYSYINTEWSTINDIILNGSIWIYCNENDIFIHILYVSFDAWKGTATYAAKASSNVPYGTDTNNGSVPFHHEQGPTTNDQTLHVKGIKVVIFIGNNTTNDGIDDCMDHWIQWM